MKIKRDNIALIGVLLLVFGIEMIVIQSVVLNSTVSGFLIRKFYPETEIALMVNDSEGNLTALPIRVPVPDTIGHCVATSGFVLILTCFIIVKDS
ncbi:MAG: hypothetical protein Q4G69_12290 [Planctomycetia bacterium]|nr:hypothetical protein [Planctomycetia bacterium]